MPEHSASASAETTAKRFRARILKPAEGVFLFHPRAMERLVTDQFAGTTPDLSVPDLAYHLMPVADFLRGLETENPEALAVIEGLNLPNHIILLPIPPEQRLDRLGFMRLLRDYWARRFEAEIARAWQSAREDNHDDETFGPAGLTHQIGSLAFAEVRDVLTRDGVVPHGLDDAYICRSFVAMTTRLRYFSPGARAFFFPTIQEWQRLDRWLSESGLDLPSALEGGRLPRLLKHTRPDQGCGQPEYQPLLPTGLPYGESDPDYHRVIAKQRQAALLRVDETGAPVPARTPPADSAAASAAPQQPPSAAPAIPHAPTAPPRGARPTTRPDPSPCPVPMLAKSEKCARACQGGVTRSCLGRLQAASQLGRRDWRQTWRDHLLFWTAPLLEGLLAVIAVLSWRRFGRTPRGVLLSLHLTLFADAVRRAQRDHLADRYANAVAQLAVALRRFNAMGHACDASRAMVVAILEERRAAATGLLADLIAAKAKLPPASARELSALTERLGLDVMHPGAALSALQILDHLEQILRESRTTYYRLRIFHWIATLGRTRLRQILPFQSDLKALRALESATNRLEQIPWSMAEIERFSQPLKQLSTGLSKRLSAQLRPHLRTALEAAGFNPRNHRERVAAHKMREELLDVIRRRRHLKFTDVRDIVARNILRLPDPTLEELRKGDRLAHFDRLAEQALPGVYKPGEIYIKGLQQLGAPLFGTPRGRLVLRHLIVPIGLAYLGLKTIDIIAGLVTPPELSLNLAPLWLVLLLAAMINLFAYTRGGRWIVVALWRVICWTFRLLLFDGIRRLLRWRPIARFLANSAIRGLDRNLFQPLLIGLALVLPFLGIGLLIEGIDIEPGLSSLVVAFAVGTLIRNTPAGRRLLDNAVSKTLQFLRRLNQTLVIGLVQELLHFFKEVTRRFAQGLHRIEELLTHQLGESHLQLVVKALFAPLWKLFEAVIQFYVTVLVEPQVNPIKHFPLVTIAHKLMLPFLPALTGLFLALTDPFLPKVLAYPIVTLTILLLPGLAGFLVWELKENWKIYAANHHGSRPGAPALEGTLGPVDRDAIVKTPVEPAIIGSHGETMRGMLRRGFHSGTLPKAFDRLRRVLREEIRDEIPYPARLRDAQRRLAEVDRALCVFCHRELSYALRLRCAEPGCGLVHVETGRPRLSGNAFDLTLSLYATQTPEHHPIALRIEIELIEPDLCLRVALSGPTHHLGQHCWTLIGADLRVFSGRAGTKLISDDLDTLLADS
ncbi:sulfite exporter TauE/SafE family protein [Thiocapsa imhoffii]|uniref:sulfite exporter TauE/SafE family protein n=1 Tax=Thiocapsa imhoffii TaxID=382777 RepID=UPI0019084FBC|nr:sulfite exporter TauE/SafE family protein [Thiocapsa imhoffii]